MKAKIYCPDIECESCVKVLNRSLSKQEGVNSVNTSDESIDIDFDEHKTNEKELIKAIEERGYRASTQPFERKTFKERIRHYKENRHKYKLEMKVISYAVTIFMILGVFEAVLYFAFLKGIPDFLGKYAIWLLYLNISVSTLTMAIWHTRSYRTNVTCMTGMMIGMTFGMQTGMMLGAVLGATNGFFIGAMTGMLLGVLVGIITGKCCGVMGIMEGMMAGLMGGTMGPMISLMMFSDHLLIFMPFYIAVNVVILWGLSYMLYEEVIEGKKLDRKPMDFTTTACIAIIVAVILLAIIVFGPKSAFIGFGLK